MLLSAPKTENHVGYFSVLTDIYITIDSLFKCTLTNDKWHLAFICRLGRVNILLSIFYYDKNIISYWL